MLLYSEACGSGDRGHPPDLLPEYALRFRRSGRRDWSISRIRFALPVALMGPDSAQTQQLLKEPSWGPLDPARIKIR